jgi:uncharacterized protein (TIGR02271 family)
MSEHIVAVFPDAESANAAERELRDAGIAAAAVRRYASDTTGETESTAQPSGFWAWLLGEEGSTRAAYRDDEAALYDRSAASGRTVLSVTVEDSRIHEAVSLLEAHHPVEMDEATEGPDGMVETNAPPARTGAAPATAANAPVPSASLPSPGQEEVIPLAAEEIEVGKRKVDRGTTRVRRYVVETPVERDVTLQSERVTVERRRPAVSTGAGAGEFQERVVEVHETDEVPMVEKHAHVAEEVAVRRETVQRTDKVRDTVRREEVEITPPGKTRPDRTGP